ncbi:DinB family protein [Spirosoma sp. HMF3257]|uniref:DinB family protein n=1 Tax=Spirosoma telluris TaxID=2183553 RepID=A0A327NIB2_9BACT|nr:DinB family protein [Spirosoma telluris]RAI73674.1 DinB family protein [Spirosoma telluris]
MLTDTLNRLRIHIDEVPIQLANFSEAELIDYLPGKWSRKEILGHLIDSALNNLKRFTDAQVTDGPYLIQSYNQNKLVVINQYQALPLAHLLSLWSSLNRQILVIIEAIPGDTLAHPVQFAQLGQFEVIQKTLAWLVEDYVVHLEHHLKTLL